MIRTGLPSGDQEDSSTFKFEMRPSDLLTTEGDPNNEAGLEEEGVENGAIFDADGKNTQLDSSFDDHHLFKNSILEDSQSI